MAEESEVEKAVVNILNGFRSIDGMSVGGNFQKSDLRLAQDDKGAVVNDVVDKYLKKELTDEYLRQIKAEHGIVYKDIIREIAKRQIEKALGI
jgi:actin-like ATPase involved in cell morphogenesis